VADEIVFWVIPLVAFVEGVGSAFYGAAQAGALRAVVPHKQLPAAVSVVTGREAVVIVARHPAARALDMDGLRCVSDLAERLRARREHRPDRACDPVTSLSSLAAQRAARPAARVCGNVS
jgi:hypothetical protein